MQVSVGLMFLPWRYFSVNESPPANLPVKHLTKFEFVVNLTS